MRIHSTAVANALECNWKSTQNYFEPEWYSGRTVPESLNDSHTTPTEDGDIVEKEESDDAFREKCDVATSEP